MKRFIFFLLTALLCLAVASVEARRGGGGGGRGGGGRSISRGGGGGRSVSRSSGRTPSFSRSPSRPSTSARPAQRPSSPVNRTPSFSRPQQRPSVGTGRPGISQRPSTPGMNRPGTGGGGIANRPGAGGSGIQNRPGTINRPGGGNVNRPNLNNRPSSRDLGNFLGISGAGAAGALAGTGISQLPANRPGAGGGGIQNRPGAGNGIAGNRPSQLPANRPGGIANRPGAGGSGTQFRPGNRPNAGNRPSQLPARGDRNGWNNYRNNRATNVRNFTQNNINYNRIAHRPGGWWGGGYRPGYGAGFVHGWGASNRWHNWGGFWGWNGYRPGYWWGAATVAGITAWGIGELFDNDDPQPIYYDYGNTTYIDNGQVYVNQQPVATEQQYAEQAIQYASAPLPEPPAVSDAGAPTDDAAMQEFADNWMPLGIFAVSRDKDDGDVSHYLQLAVSKDGHIAGTCYNTIKDETLPISGSVDKKSQRAAWKMGDNDDVVMETGLFNLTQDTAPALIHFGKDKTESRLLVRMEQPKQ